MKRATPGPTALYRYFDENDRLLYVGIAVDVSSRHKTHVASSRWMTLAARSTIDRLPTRKAAEDAERKAIENEHPLFNKQYNDTLEARDRLKDYLTETGNDEIREAIFAPAPKVLMLPSVGTDRSLEPVEDKPSRADVIARIWQIIADVANLASRMIGVAEDHGKLITEMDGRIRDLENRLEAVEGARAEAVPSRRPA